MRRRRFMELLGAASIAGSTVASVGSAGSVSTGVSSLEFDSTSSLLAADRTTMADDSNVAVWAGPDAENQDTDWWGNAVDYGGDPIPLVAVDGDAVGVGAPLVADSKMDGGDDNVQFLLNVWDELVDGNRIAWDDAHDTYWTLDEFTTFKAEAQSAGYVISAAGDLERELDDADAFVMMPPRRDVRDAEREAIADFLADGGVVFLHNQSDYNDYDQSQRLNYVARGLELDFRFNDDQVVDFSSNAGASYEPVTGTFNDDFPFFGDGDGGGGAPDPDPNESPDAAFTTSAGTVSPDESVTFDAGGSEDPDGTIVAHEWTLGDGTTATGPTVDHAYGSTGEYTVTLTVEDDDGATATATRTVTVESSDGGGTDRIVVDVTSVADGDTVSVEMPDGSSESVRILGVDTPETAGNADNEYTPEWEGIETKSTLGDWGAKASEYAKDELAGETVELAFDEREGKRDFFDRLLGYIHYDADGDGSRDTLYNEQVVRDGYARVYGSSLTKHDRIQAAESRARADERGLWTDSDPLNSEVIRNGSVDELYVPKATRVTSSSGSLPASRVPVAAAPTASPSEAPLVGVDEDANVAMLGGMMPTDDYESVDGFEGDTSNYSNYAFVANLVDYLAGKSGGDVAFEGAHGQFGAQFSMSSEDAAFFQRFFEPFGIDVDQFNDLASADLSGYRAVFVASPTSALSSAQLDALSSFTANGGAVVLMGTAAAKDGANGRINDVASALGSDLRLDDVAVTDSATNVDGNENLPATSNFTTSFPLFSPYSTDGSVGTTGSKTETYEGTVAAGGGETLTYETQTANPATVTLTLDGPSSADFDLYATVDGRIPTTKDYDARSWTYGSSEELSFGAGDISTDATLGILVDAYDGSGEFSLTVEETVE